MEKYSNITPEQGFYIDVFSYLDELFDTRYIYEWNSESVWEMDNEEDWEELRKNLIRNYGFKGSYRNPDYLEHMKFKMLVKRVSMGPTPEKYFVYAGPTTTSRFKGEKFSGLSIEILANGSLEKYLTPPESQRDYLLKLNAFVQAMVDLIRTYKGDIEREVEIDTENLLEQYSDEINDLRAYRAYLSVYVNRFGFIQGQNFKSFFEKKNLVRDFLKDLAEPFHELSKINRDIRILGFDPEYNKLVGHEIKIMARILKEYLRKKEFKDTIVKKVI